MTVTMTDMETPFCNHFRSLRIDGCCLCWGMTLLSAGLTREQSPRPLVLLTALSLALSLSACGSSSTTDRLTSPPTSGTYHGMASSSTLGNAMLSGTVSGSSVSLVFKDHLGETGWISGTFSFSDNTCFTGSAAFRSGSRPFALVDCTMKDGRLSATVQSMTRAAFPTALAAGGAATDVMVLQSSTSIPASSGTVYTQYNYVSRAFTPVSLTNTEDLVMSNYVAGAMLGHLIREYRPNLAFDRDRIYGSIFAHLLQEDGANLKVSPYDPSRDTIDDSGKTSLALVMDGGGPYQLNSWYSANTTAFDWPNPDLYYGLVNLIALQGSLGGFTTDQQAAGMVPATAPDIFNNKYWAPMAAAYWHFQNLARIEAANKETAYDMAACEAALDPINALALKHNIFDMILNASYNSGASTRNDGITGTEALVGLCQNAASTATQTTITGTLLSNSMATDAYGHALGITSTKFWDVPGGAYPAYIDYPRQLRFTADQVNGPSAGVTGYPTSMFDSDTQKTITPTYDATAIVAISDLETVFENVMAMLYYVNSSRAYVQVSASDAQAAFVKANTSVNTGSKTYATMTTAADRTLVFDILDAAISNLKATLVKSSVNFVSFSDTTQSMITR